MKFRIAVSASLLLVLLGTGFAQETPEKPLTIEPNIADGQLVKKVDPAYPQMAKIAHIEGDVVLKASIAKSGTIENLRAVSGHPILIQSAMDAVRQWKYKPWLVNGEPVAVETTITVRYRLPKTKAQAEQELNRPIEPPPNPESPSTVPKKVRISSGVADRNKISGDDPAYPEMARVAHVQGDVVMRATIDKSGDIQSLAAISGHPILIQPAMDAVRHWKYKPWILNGEPVEVETTITIKFHM